MALENVTASLVLDVINHDQSPATVKAIALDSKTRYVRATITKDGLDYSVDENATVTLTILRPDNVGVQITGSVVDVDNADRTDTIKGVYSELSQAALAKSGTLRAQFKITSGEQILRTEIFQIKNGIALDGETDTWADQYEGHNLDELIETVNASSVAVNQMETELGDLKSNFQETFPVAWADGSGITTAAIVIGKYRNLERNTLTTDDKYAVSSSLNASNRKAVTFTNPNYEFAVIAYNSQTASSAYMIGGYGWFPANTIVVLPPETVIFVYQVRKSTTIEESEETAIKEGIKTFVPTDPTLSISGKSADAKATGDALEALRPIPAKTVLAIGDSICSGGRNGGKGFIGDVGLEYVNAGVSGATISTIRDTTTHWIENQLTAQTDDFDVVIMQGGINDYIYDATLGTMSTVPVRKEDSAFASLNTETVIGALEHLFATCINKYPNADRFFLISHKTREYAWTAGNGGWTQEQLHDAIVACCRLYNVGVIDVYAESPINTHYTEYVSPIEWSNDHSIGDSEWVDNDRVHPLSYGYLHGYVPLIKKALIATSSKGVTA